MLNISSRAFDIGGRNLPELSWLITNNLRNVTAAQVLYDGDNPRNVTTLNHVLDYNGIIPNATIGDVMDIRGGSLLCYEYV